MTIALSIIIPLAPGETCWRQLLPLLRVSPEDEIIIAASEPPPAEPPAAARWLHCAAAGRAGVMNEAARAAAKEFLWFLHADSRPEAAAISRLRESLARRPDGLHYFNLRFYDGGLKMRINEFGVRWRCRLFANPFGDQALCMSKALFERLGAYDESAACGEDHLLALRAGRAAMAPVAAAVATSARRYEQHGWWRTVRLYQRVWWRQWRQR